LIKSIAELVNEKRIDGISNVNDESDREGMRIVVDVKRDANANVVLNKLFKMTALQCSFSVNCIALVHGRPKLLTLKDCISNFVDHRHDVVIRRTQYDLRKAEERAHILRGLIIASDNIDEVVRIIRASRNPQEAMQGLMQRFGLDDIQAKAIVDMRLAQLTNIQQEKLHQEHEEIERRIAYYKQILSDEVLCKLVIKDELIEVKEKYADESILVQGVIDLLFVDENDNLVLADYKTDWFSDKDIISGNAEKILIERHKTQLSYYAEACEKMFGKKVDKILIYSFALGKTIEI
jgi:DNA gyrase subunit A